MTYSIHPRIGIARLGNSQQAFYLGPETTGGLPIDCDKFGKTFPDERGVERVVKDFRDPIGGLKRQAARFKIFKHVGPGESQEVKLGDTEHGLERIEWTVHLANKKAVWYEFSELAGDRGFADNSYADCHVPLRNASVQGDEERREKLIIDPGPRSVAAPGQRQEFSRFSPPAGYSKFSFPPDDLSPSIDTLGEIRMDADGRLIVLGGYGNSAGKDDLASFGGGDGWYDDTSDGYVAATLIFADGTREELEPAWVIVGSPKYAPELVNIVTLDDTLFDLSVRHLGAQPDLYEPVAPETAPSRYVATAGFKADFRVNYERDIEPILRRFDGYRWVANIPTMQDFARPRFDPRDSSKDTASARKQFFRNLRIPVPPEHYDSIGVEYGPNALLGPDGKTPMMPLNSGDNSVTNDRIYKFLTLTPTQYFFMEQWSKGHFTSAKDPVDPEDRERGEPGRPVARPQLFAGMHDLDRAVLGNLVGAPFSPGIETTWIVRNPALYDVRRPYAFKVAHWDGPGRLADMKKHYEEFGLSPTHDPDGGQGAEPGDLTKRMAVPWQADFYACSVEAPNAVDPSVNQLPGQLAVPPVYNVYWWPPQSPVDVISGDMDRGNQVLDGFISAQLLQIASPGGSAISLQSQSNYSVTAAGQQVNYARGISTFNQMTSAWQHLGFIVNVGTDAFPNFVESQRNVLILAQGSARPSDD